MVEWPRRSWCGGKMGEKKENVIILENENENTYLGGIVRNALRSISYITRIESIGRLPVRIPTKIVGKSADKISQITDVIDRLQTAYNDVKDHKISSKLKSFFHVSAKAYHGMVKSGILGGILFSLYEEIVSRVHSQQCLPLSNQSKDFNELVWYSSLVSASAGAVSGGSHGILYSLWDRSLHSITSYLKLPSQVYEELSLQILTTRPQFFTLGTCVSHTLVHGSLFGTYELTKRTCLYLLNLTHETDHLTKLEGGLSIISGGLAAGVMSDTIGALTAPFEEFGILEGIQSIVKNRPQISYSIRSLGPTILGFLAYEYTKEGFTDE